MTEQRFAFLHLEGGRFSEHPGKIPVECLHEIAIYRRCIASLASDAWRRDNPERERLPRNFTQDFQLSLTDIDSGSALPYIERQTADLGLDDYFDAAREKFTSLLSSLSKGQTAPAGMSRASSRLFRGFGKSFRASEIVTLGHPVDQSKRVSLNAADRERIHSMDLSESTTEQDVSLLGKIANWNIEGRSFDLRHEGRLVKGATTGVGTDVSTFLVDGESVPVVIEGRARLDADGVALAFESHVEVTDASAVLRYLDTALNPNVVPGINEAVVGMVRRWTPFWLRVAPNFGVVGEEGELRVEWDCDGWDCSMEIDADGKVFAHRYHAASDKDVESEIPTFDGDDASSLVDSWTVGAW